VSQFASIWPLLTQIYASGEGYKMSGWSGRNRTGAMQKKKNIYIYIYIYIHTNTYTDSAILISVGTEMVYGKLVFM